MLAPRTLPHGDHDVAVVIADGLSPLAVHSHAVPVLERLIGWDVAPVVMAEQAGVALLATGWPWPWAPGWWWFSSASGQG